MEHPWGVPVALILWVGAGWKGFQSLRVPESRGIRLLTVFFVSFALTTSIWAVPTPFDAFIDPALGPGSTVLLRNIVPIPGFYAGAMFLLYSSAHDTRRRRVLWIRTPMALWAITAVASWYAAPPGDRSGELTDVSSTGHVVYFAISLIGIGYSGACLAAPLTYLIARTAPDRVAARGLYVAVAGFFALLPFSVLRLVALGTAVTGHTPSHALELVAMIAQLLALTLLVLGFGWPVGRAKLAAAWQWTRHYQLLGQMHPLRDALRDRFPGHQLDHDASPTSPLRIHHRFYRCVVECRDGLLLAGRIAGPDAAPHDVSAEAELLRSVLDQRQDTVEPGPPGWVFVVPDGQSVEDDAEALAALSAALQNTPAASAAGSSDRS